MLDENKVISIESIQISRDNLKLDININDFSEIFYHLNLSILTIGIPYRLVLNGSQVSR
jgi:hypothetical protein